MGGYNPADSLTGSCASSRLNLRVSARVRWRYGIAFDSGIVHFWRSGVVAFDSVVMLVEEVLAPDEVVSLRGRDGRCASSDVDLDRLRLGPVESGGGSGADAQGERRCFIHVVALKKSIGIGFPVLRSTKHCPSSGRNTNDVRNVKFT